MADVAPFRRPWGQRAQGHTGQHAHCRACGTSPRASRTVAGPPRARHRPGPRSGPLGADSCPLCEGTGWAPTRAGDVIPCPCRTDGVLPHGVDLN